MAALGVSGASAFAASDPSSTSTSFAYSNRLTEYLPDSGQRDPSMHSENGTYYLAMSYNGHDETRGIRIESSRDLRTWFLVTVADDHTGTNGPELWAGELRKLGGKYWGQTSAPTINRASIAPAPCVLQAAVNDSINDW